jgi:hypothetical protein
MSEQTTKPELVDPAIWQAILDRSKRALSTRPTRIQRHIDNWQLSELFQKVFLECADNEVALPRDLAQGKIAGPNNRRIYTSERLAVRIAGLTHLHLSLALKVPREVNNNFIFDTTDPRYVLEVLHTFDPLAVGSAVAERFSFETDPYSLVHEVDNPALFDKSQGELQELDAYARLGAYLLHGCEPAYLLSSFI